MASAGSVALLVTGDPQSGYIQAFEMSVTASLIHSRISVEELPAATSYVFHLPPQFIINRFIPLSHLTEVMRSRPHLVQMALRQSGKVVKGRASCDADRPFLQWVEHREFTLNVPALYPAWVLAEGWPTQDQAEAELAETLLANPQARCGVWGQRGQWPWTLRQRPVVELKSRFL